MEITLFIFFVLISIIFRILQPKIKRYIGEKSVAAIQSFLPSDKYKIIKDKTLGFISFHTKSPIVYENCYFQNRQNRIWRELWFTYKKSTLKGAYHKWCAILCSYRTKFYEDFKELSRKIELFRDIDIS